MLKTFKLPPPPPLHRFQSVVFYSEDHFRPYKNRKNNIIIG